MGSVQTVIANLVTVVALGLLVAHIGTATALDQLASTNPFLMVAAIPWLLMAAIGRACRQSVAAGIVLLVVGIGVGAMGLVTFFGTYSHPGGPTAKILTPLIVGGNQAVIIVAAGVVAWLIALRAQGATRNPSD